MVNDVHYHDSVTKLSVRSNNCRCWVRATVHLPENVGYRMQFALDKQHASRWQGTDGTLRPAARNSRLLCAKATSAGVTVRLTNGIRPHLSDGYDAEVCVYDVELGGDTGQYSKTSIGCEPIIRAGIVLNNGNSDCRTFHRRLLTYGKRTSIARYYIRNDTVTFARHVP